MIERPGMRPPPGVFRPPPSTAPAEGATADKEDGEKKEGESKEKGEEEKPAVEKPPARPAAVIPSGPPKPETPWERGLRQAKEVWRIRVKSDM